MDREVKRAIPVRHSRSRNATGSRDEYETTIAPEAATTAAKILLGRQAPPATLVIFGAGGDLTKRLVVPALYNLVRAGKLPDEFAIIGVDHNDETTEQWRQSLTEMMQAFTRAGRRSTSRPGHGSPAACTICPETLRSLKPSASWRSCWSSNGSRTIRRTSCSIWRSPTGSSVR